MRDGDDWVIDGQKIFTSNAQQADWIWLACRTDPEAPKHRGISIVLVPTGRPRLLLDADPHREAGSPPPPPTTTAYARPVTNLVGEENGGWKLITSQLNHERVALAAIGMQAEDFYEEASPTPAPPTPRPGAAGSTSRGCAPGSRRRTPGSRRRAC